MIFLIKVQKMRRIITCLVLLVLVIRVEVSAQLFVDWGSQWSYFKGISEPSQPIDLWRTAGFNATGWAVGNAPFRYGDGTGGTLLTDMLGKYTTFYIRKEIFVETLDNIDELRIDVDYDDGFVLWINGVQILQSNVPSNYAYTQGAINSHESGEFERYTLRKEQLPLAEGANLIAVQGFNLSKSSSDFYLDLKMEGVKWLPETTEVETFALSPDTRKLLIGMGHQLGKPQPANHAAGILIGAPSLGGKPIGNNRFYGAIDPRRNTGLAAGY